MKKLLKLAFVVAFAVISLHANAQLINCNPNPNGNPWWAGGIPEITPEIQAWLDAIPQLTLINGSQNALLDDVVDNSQHTWFRPIFLQNGGSCAQAAGVGYLFTYEVNRVRDPQQNETSNPNNQYPTHFTWNFLNNGDGSGSFYQQGWDIIKESGVPTVAQYGGLWKPYNDEYQIERVWETGYNNYNQALQNEVIDSYYSIDVKTTVGLNDLKHWLSDHGANESTGGLANFSCYMNTGEVYVQLPPESAEAGKTMVKRWGTTGKHAMTIVGYNDNIKFDFNGDGQFTNPGNNLGEWEIGALKVANSWGTDYPYEGSFHDGFVYMPYRLLAQIPGSISENRVHVLNVGTSYTPELNLKALVSHSCRNKIGIMSGYADNACKSLPDESRLYKAFKYNGGCWYMQGINTDPIEVCLDFNNLFENNNVGKLFFIIDENDEGNDEEGFIHELSLIDYRWDEEFELPLVINNPVNLNNDTTTILAINYHLLPHHNEHITNEYRVTCDRVSRFTTNVDNGGNLNLSAGVNIDMYNSTIQINGGGILKLNGNNTITAKRGNCRIIIDGSISLNSGLNCKAEEGATLELIIRRGAIVNNNTINGINLNNAKIMNYSDNIIITGFQAFNNSTIQSYGGNVTIMNGGCEESNIRLENFLSDQSAKATVKSVVFGGNNNNSIRALFVYNYGKYEISNNIIADYNMGIQLMLCGNGTSGNQIINNNQIYGHTSAGVLAYNTTGKFSGLNKIYDNGYGLQFFNKCLISIEGNSLATDISQTQQIYDNASYELYATQLGFPTYCRYNYISDYNNGGNPNDPIVYYDNNVQGSYQLVDVSRNCWGTGFNASQDLKINNGYIQFIPFWCPGGGGGNPTSNLAEQLYNTALAYADSGMCVIASSYYKEVIDQYPQSEYAMQAMKQLYHIEECAGGHYDSLSNYFLGNGSIINDSTLAFLGRYLSNECKIAQQDWPAAIAWYENQITHPYSPEDSLFALIDLEHLYIIMENSGLKQAVVGKMANLKPKSSEQFFQDADYYLSLLPFKKEDNKNQNLKQTDLCKLEQNTPNPFNSTTSIKYSLSQSAIVKLVITDMTGRVLYDKMEGNKDKGNYTVTLNNLKLESGNYLYSIYLNDKLFDTKKMTIIK